MYLHASLHVHRSRPLTIQFVPISSPTVLPTYLASYSTAQRGKKW